MPDTDGSDGLDRDFLSENLVQDNANDVYFGRASHNKLAGQKIHASKSLQTCGEGPIQGRVTLNPNLSRSGVGHYFESLNDRQGDIPASNGIQTYPAYGMLPNLCRADSRIEQTFDPLTAGNLDACKPIP